MVAAHRTVPNHIDIISGTTLDGRDVTDLEVVELIRGDGSLTIVRGPAHRLRRSDWAGQFGVLALMHGVQSSVRDTGRLVLILNIDWAGWALPPATNHTQGMNSSRAAHPSGQLGPRALPNLST